MCIRFSLVVLLVWLSTVCAAQDSNSGQELARVSRELQETRADLSDSRREIQELRKSVEELRARLEPNRQSETAGPSASAEPSTATADQDVSFLAAKVRELHQDKVESASKYPVKISGLVLFNSYLNHGTLDAEDLPSLAFPRFPGYPNGSLGATMSQTLLALEVGGPRVFGARSSADVAMDFGGGSPETPYGITSGLFRLRAANVHLDWGKTSLNVGQDALFFSPLSPTSYATLKQPALSWAGNLWVWTPQIEVEHRFALRSNSAFFVQGGFLDPLTEEVPPFQGRMATAGEATRVPAVAGRIAFDRSSAEHYPFTIGFGGYRAQQKYGTFPDIDSWTVNADLTASLGRYLEFSGEWYRGQAVGGIGGGIWTSVLYPNPSGLQPAIHPLHSTGGWMQWKVKPTTRLEMNAALGQDENYGKDLRFFPVPFSGYGFPALQKNKTGFVNAVYKPGEFLLFALEYRRIFTAPVESKSASGDQVNLAAGVRF